MSTISPKDVHGFIGKHMLADVLPVVVDLERSLGNRLVDSISGKSYLDCISYIASNPIGHNHLKLSDVAFNEKLLRVARTKPSLSDFYTEEFADFVETFVRIAQPKHFKYLFFVEGGSAAVENAIKVAFDWKVRHNFARGEKRERGTQILHFRDAFHGRGGYTLSLTNTADPNKTKYFPKFAWPRVLNPKISFPLSGEHLAAVVAAEQQSIAEMRASFAEHGNDIAAIIIEPIQAEGGDNHFRPEFHRALRQLADEQDVLLIYDEVQTGVGLTGQMWCYEHFGITPDIICFGKKMQVCGIMVSDRVETVEGHAFQEKSRINSTWGGSLTDMIRCQRYLEIIQEDQLVKNAAEVGAYLLRRLEELQQNAGSVFSNARGKGLMCAIDLPTTSKRDAMMKQIMDRGVLILKCGQRSLRFRPSLTFSKAEVDELITVVQSAINPTR